MSGSHRSLLVRHIGPLLVFWELSILKYFLGFFLPKQFDGAQILEKILSFVVS